MPRLSRAWPRSRGRRNFGRDPAVTPASDETPTKQAPRRARSRSSFPTTRASTPGAWGEKSPGTTALPPVRATSVDQRRPRDAPRQGGHTQNLCDRPVAKTPRASGDARQSPGQYEGRANTPAHPLPRARRLRRPTRAWRPTLAAPSCSLDSKRTGQGRSTREPDGGTPRRHSTARHGLRGTAGAILTWRGSAPRSPPGLQPARPGRSERRRTPACACGERGSRGWAPTSPCAHLAP